MNTTILAPAYDSIEEFANTAIEKAYSFIVAHKGSILSIRLFFEGEVYGVKYTLSFAPNELKENGIVMVIRAENNIEKRLNVARLSVIFGKKIEIKESKSEYEYNKNNINSYLIDQNGSILSMGRATGYFLKPENMGKIRALSEKINEL